MTFEKGVSDAVRWSAGKGGTFFGKDSSYDGPVDLIPAYGALRDKE